MRSSRKFYINFQKIRGMEEAVTWLKHQHRVYSSGRSPVEGYLTKRTRVQYHTQAWARYRGLVEKYQEGH
jgi:hypothetical protein